MLTRPIGLGFFRFRSLSTIAPRNSTRTKTWFFEKNIFPLIFRQNGCGAKADSRSQEPYGPCIKALWTAESTREIVYGLFDFSRPIYFFT